MTVGTAIRMGVAGIAIAVQTASAEFSPPILVDGGIRSAHWSTMFTNAVDLEWSWIPNATYATLNITGMNGSVTTNFTTATSNWLWRAFASDVPLAEDVYDLRLKFYANDSGGVIVGALTSRLVMVTGAFGEVTVNATSNNPAWAKIKDNRVIPYNACWLEVATNAASTQLVIAKVGGATQTNAFADAAGYFGWKIKNSGWGYGVFDLSLTFPGTTADALTAELTRPMDGTMIRVR